MSYVVNYGPMSYRFQHKWQYLQNYPTSVLLTEGFLWDFVTAVG